MYYGQKVSKDFLINNEKETKNIIKRLIEIVDEKLKGMSK